MIHSQDNTYIIGVDNGFGMTKTANVSFPTSIKNYGKINPPIMNRVICLDGNYYCVGDGDRLKVSFDKTTDDNTYILTLAGVAEELKLAGLTEAEIILSVGLPIEQVGSGKDAFRDYFKKRGEVSFTYEDIPYHIIIKDVVCSPQGYSAVIKDIMAGDVPDNTVLVDIGSWTVDILPIINTVPQINKCLSLNDGAITCILSVNSEFRRIFGSEVMEQQIQQIMIGETPLPAKYMDVAKKVIRRYIESIASSLQEQKFNIETLNFIFLGGGASIVKNFGMDLFPMARVFTDLKSNAIGYEFIAAARQKK